MTYEADTSFARPLNRPRPADRHLPLRSSRLEAGSWLGLIVALVVILAGAVTVYLGPGLTDPTTGRAEVVTPSVVQVIPPDVTSFPGERIPPSE